MPEVCNLVTLDLGDPGLTLATGFFFGDMKKMKLYLKKYKETYVKEKTMSCLNEIDSLTFDTEMTIKERVKIPGNTGSEKDRDSIFIYKCTIGRVRFSTGAMTSGD